MKLTSKQRKSLLTYIKANPETVFRELAEKFNCSISTVREAYYQVFPGESPPASRRATTKMSKKRARHEEKIRRRRQAIQIAAENKEATYLEIADKTGLSLNMVRLICDGAGLRNEHRVPGKVCDRGVSVSDINSERSQTILKAIKENWTLKELGSVLGVTRERARQLICLYEQQHGVVERPKEYSIRTLAKRFKVSDGSMRKLVFKYGLGRVRGSSQFVLTEEEVAKLPELILLAKRADCQFCGKIYFGKVMFPKIGYCSTKCYKQSIYKRGVDRLKAPITEENADKYIPLVKKIKSSDAGSVFIPLKEARTISGATSMQLAYLRNRGLIRTQPAKSGMLRQGIPHKDYSLEDIKKLGEFLQETK